MDLVAIHNKQIIANGTLHCEGIYWENTAELKIFVDPDYRSKGIGTQLFMLLIKEGLQKQFKKIIVRYKTNNFSFNKILEYYSIRPETIYNYIAENKMFNESKLMNIATINIEDWKKRFEFYNLFFKD
ncbi:MAG: GNAT family N-acetyltransferase [Candidatus Dadabacteria bacterium]|nr:GNAT family N-acetyltransferase [Candidatus Dadabacteria bacterium]